MAASISSSTGLTSSKGTALQLNTATVAAVSAAKGDAKAIWAAATTVTLLGGKGAKALTGYDANGKLKEALTPEQRAKLDANERLARQAKNAVDSMKSSRKGDAKKRIEQIKEQIKALRMSGGDPKQIARQIARLARELREAVKEYAAAGAGASAAANPVEGGAPVAAAEGAAPTEAPNPEATAAMVAPNGAAGTAKPDSGEQANADDASAPTGLTSEAPGAEESADGSDTEQPDRELRSLTGAEQRADEAKRAAEKKADEDTIRDAKLLAQQLKAMLERAKREARLEKKENSFDIADASKNVGETIREIEKIGQELKPEHAEAASMPLDPATDTPAANTLDVAPVLPGSFLSIVA